MAVGIITTATLSFAGVTGLCRWTFTFQAVHRPPRRCSTACCSSRRKSGVKGASRDECASHPRYHDRRAENPSGVDADEGDLVDDSYAWRTDAECAARRDREAALLPAR